MATFVTKKLYGGAIDIKIPATFLDARYVKLSAKISCRSVWESVVSLRLDGYKCQGVDRA